MFSKITNLAKTVNWLLRADEDSYIIYQPGKVGSSAVEASLKEAGKDVMHIHQAKSAKVEFLPVNRLSRFKRLRATVYLAFVSWAFRRSGASVIVIVRDPVDHLMSLTFHHLDKILYLYFTLEQDTRKHVAFTDILDQAHDSIVNANYSNDWFEQDFLALTGLDSTQLPSSKGYPVSLSCRNRRYLFLRYEDLNDSLEQLSEFTRLPALSLPQVNASTRKWYAALYQEAKTAYNLRPELQKTLKATRYARTFYH